MAGTEIKEALRAAADVVAKYVRDAAELQVETKVIVVGSGQAPTLAASTTIRLDGDNTAVIPGNQNDAGKWEIDTVLYDLHVQNVRAAIDYRARMVGELLRLLRPTAGGGT